MSAVQDISSIGTMAIIGIAVYFGYKFLTGQDDKIINPTPSNRCGNLTGLAKSLCELGGDILPGDPLASCNNVQLIVNNLNRGQCPSGCQWQFMRNQEHALYTIAINQGCDDWSSLIW